MPNTGPMHEKRQSALISGAEESPAIAALQAALDVAVADLALTQADLDVAEAALATAEGTIATLVTDLNTAEAGLADASAAVGLILTWISDTATKLNALGAKLNLDAGVTDVDYATDFDTDPTA